MVATLLLSLGLAMAVALAAVAGPGVAASAQAQTQGPAPDEVPGQGQVQGTELQPPVPVQAHAPVPAQAQGPASGQTPVLRIATAQNGSHYQRLGELFAALWREKLEAEVLVQLSQGSPHNVELLQAQAVDLAFLRADWANRAYYGVESDDTNSYSTVNLHNGTDGGPSAPVGPFRGMAFVTHVYPEVLHFLGDSSTRTLRDVAGRPVAVGMPGSYGEWAVRQRILPLVELDYNAFRPQFVGLPWAVDHVRHWQISGYLGFEPLPSPGIAQMLATGRVSLRSLDQDVVVAASDGVLYPFTIPAATYSGQESDILTLATAVILVARTDLDEELVYQLTRWLYQEQESLRRRYPLAGWLQPRNALHGQTFPLHPGAQCYYREVGMVP